MREREREREREKKKKKKRDVGRHRDLKPNLDCGFGIDSDL